MENQAKAVALRTWRRILDHLSRIKGCEIPQRETSWYRGLTPSQLAAASSLSTILPDNMDENTASGVAKLIGHMGLHPAPSLKTLCQAIQLSRGNDLAFLWFLMELCYKTPNHGETYSANEQIIMSAIFRLDLLPTLRELDRWLPLPHSSKAHRDKAEARRKRSQGLRKERERERQKEQARKAKVSSPLSPYFQEHNISGRLRSERRLLSEYPSTPALLFGMEEEPPESQLWTRWFGSYNLSEAHRIGMSIVLREINSIFESFKAACLPPREVESLCAHHQHIREMEKSLKAQMELIKRRKCEELVNASNRLQERKRKRVIQELEDMSACYLKRFQEMAARARLASTRKQLFGGSFAKAFPFCYSKIGQKCDDFEEERCQTFEADAPPERDSGQHHRNSSRCSRSRTRLASGAQRKVKSKSRSRSRSRSRSKTRRKMKRSTTEKSKVVEEKPPRKKGKDEFEDIEVRLLEGDKPILPGCPDFNPEIIECAKCHTFDPRKSAPGKQSMEHRPSSLMQFLRLCGSEKIEMERSVLEQDTNPSHSAQSPKPSVQLLELGPPGGGGVRFNYRELFGSMHRTHLDDERSRLKEAFVRAIDDDVQYLSAALNGEEEGSIDALVDRAAKRVFAEDVKAFHKELQKLQSRRAAKARTESRLDFGQEFYDPDNIPLMREMLRLGLEKVAQDKRYVLPTLPNVHSLPYLIEWIRLRYGKRYSHREKERILAKDKLVMDQMTWLMQTSLVNIPSLPFTDNVRNLGKLREVANRQRERHTNHFLEAMMEVERVFYSAMKPQFCPMGTESTFLAYLPAHFFDLGFTIKNQGEEQGVFH